MSKHTELPWIKKGTTINSPNIGNVAGTYIPYAVDDTRLEGESWLAMRRRTQPERDDLEKEIEANAAFIVKACNNHENLLEALGDVVTQYRFIHGDNVPAWIRNAEQAIKDASDE